MLRERGKYGKEREGYSLLNRAGAISEPARLHANTPLNYQRSEGDCTSVHLDSGLSYSLKGGISPIQTRV